MQFLAFLAIAKMLRNLHFLDEAFSKVI